MKTSVYIAASLDGFIARENGDLDWLSKFNNDSSEEDYGFQEYMNSIDTVVMGRNKFEMVVSSGKWRYENKLFIVLSSKKIQIPGNFPPTIEIFTGLLSDLIQNLTARGKGHVYVDGGKTIQGFLNANLIQEIIITRIPILLGKGIPLFGPVLEDINLKLLESRTFENGFVQSRYEVINL